MLFLVQDPGPENERFEFGIDCFAQLVSRFSFTRDFRAISIHALHDFLLHSERREGDLETAQLFAVDVVLHDLATYGIHLLTTQRRVEKLRSKFGHYRAGGEAKAN
jgi:hypothetical protein